MDDHQLTTLCDARGVLGFDATGRGVRAYLVGRGGQVSDYIADSAATGPVSPRTAFSGEFSSVEAARRSGRMWGAAYGQNPWDLARAYSIRVNMASRREIEADRRPPAGQRVMGYTRKPAGVWIDESMHSAAQDETLAHELAHWLDDSASEALCNEWAASFLGVAALGRAA